MNQLIQVPFEGDKLEVVKTSDSEDGVFVSVKRVCEILGMSEKVQLRKLTACAWSASVTKMVTGARGGVDRTVTMISLKSLPLWLATISPQRVLPDVAEKLKKYQMQCRDVLYRHFFGAPEEKRPAIAEIEFQGWKPSDMPNLDSIQRLRTATELVEKHDQLMVLEHHIACERLGIRVELSKFGVNLSRY